MCVYTTYQTKKKEDTKRNKTKRNKTKQNLSPCRTIVLRGNCITQILELYIRHIFIGPELHTTQYHTYMNQSINSLLPLPKPPSLIKPSIPLHLPPSYHQATYLYFPTSLISSIHTIHPIHPIPIIPTNHIALLRNTQNTDSPIQYNTTQASLPRPSKRNPVNPAASKTFIQFQSNPFHSIPRTQTQNPKLRFTHQPHKKQPNPIQHNTTQHNPLTPLNLHLHLNSSRL